MSSIEDKRPPKDPVAQRYSTIGWAIFLILAGAVMLLPHALVPEGFLWIAAGVILIAYRGAVAARGIASSFGLVIAGVAFIVIGASDFINFNIDIFPVVLIVCGVVLLGKAMSAKDG
jgi:hypothetical protein